MASDDVPIAETELPPARCLEVVLKPISHPELGDIRIRHDLFAVGRSEAPFDRARSEVVAELSRRHARIFVERGAAYIADLGSKNGTTVNGAAVRDKPSLLHDGDEIRFAGVLAYRVELAQCTSVRTPSEAGSVVLTLTPERSDLGLEPIVVTSFPFLVSKADEVFARYREAYPHQVNYVSRRHAHVFVERGEIFVEDLGSTNGTFVDGVRLEERAVELADGARLAFGGNHFVYRVGVQRGGSVDRTLTQMRAQAPAKDQSNAAPKMQAEDGAQNDRAAPSVPIPVAADMDRTTFIAAPHSFLDIFCVDSMNAREDEVNYETVSPNEPPSRSATKRRGKVATFIDELNVAMGGSGTSAWADAWDGRRIARYALVALALVGVIVVASYLHAGPQRDMRALMDDGRFDAAAQLADRYLSRHPGDAMLEAAGADALMKAKVPAWLTAIDAHGFDRAGALVSEMKTLASHNREAAPLASEIAWMGEVEAYWFGRGGADAPIAIFHDEPVIGSLVARWNDDPNQHQRMLDRITSYVPAFGRRYADALSHLRQLQTDDSVYVAALDRLKSAIDASLEPTHPERLDALPALLDDYASRYPRLAGGFGPLRGDLSRYREILGEVRGGDARAAADALNSVRFATPPFQAHRAALRAFAAAAHGSGQ